MRSHLLVGTSSQLSWEDFENKAGLKLRFKKKKKSVFHHKFFV